MNIRILHYAGAMLLAAGLLVMNGCGGGRVAVGAGPGYQEPGRGPGPKEGPPPWAPAHGYRGKHQYHYYPSAQVYFDIGRRIYFYYQSGRWEASAQLPAAIKARLGGSVGLEMDTDRPYEFHKEVLRRHPPGRPNDKVKSKGKGRQ